MAQTRLRNYKNPIGSFQHNIFNLGLRGPGRYCGFDTVQQTLALSFDLAHVGTGFNYKDEVNNVHGPIGVIMTPQGVLVQEDAPINLTIDTNAGNPEMRYDLVYADHSHAVIAGGAAATYHILKGAIGNPIKPILADPLKQTAIGVIEIPAGAIDIAQTRYFKSKSPDSGDGEDARLYDVNVFGKLQAWNKSANIYKVNTTNHIHSTHNAKLWTFDNDGNVFTMDPTNPITLDGITISDAQLQEGTRISLMITDKITVRESYWFQASLGNLGYRPFKINPGFGNVLVGTDGGGINFGINPIAGEVWELELLFYQDKWWVLKIGGAGSKSQFTRGDMIEWFGDINSNFDATGLGINIKAGWAICNGNNGTPDRRGKGTVMATEQVPFAARPNIADEAAAIASGLNPDEYVYGVPYDLQGDRGFYIFVPNLPNYNLITTDPGHFHNTTIPSRDFQNDNNTGPDLTGGDGGAAGGSNRNFNSNVKTTGIMVNSAGGDEKLYHVIPHFKTLYIMKL